MNITTRKPNRILSQGPGGCQVDFSRFTRPRSPRYEYLPAASDALLLPAAAPEQDGASHRNRRLGNQDGEERALGVQARRHR